MQSTYPNTPRDIETERIILVIPSDLLVQIERVKPAAQSRSEWIREAIRLRLAASTH